MADIFAFAETRKGAIRKVALEAVTAARSLADAAGGAVHAFVAGPGVSKHAAALGGNGADVVLTAEHEGLSLYNPEALAAICAERIKSGGYRAAVFPASAQGKDLAPRVAAKLGVPIATDAIAMSLEGNAITLRHPANTGKTISTLSLTATPAVVSIRPNVFTPHESKRDGRVEALQLSVDPAASRVRVTELKEGGSGKVDLGEAQVIVAGGRGLRAK